MFDMSLVPGITIGICPTAKQGVAIADFSARHSRMWAWDAETLEVVGHQDVKGHAELLDISRDGRYCSYFVVSHSKQESYVAISKPPYFRALWLKNHFHCFGRLVAFESDKVIRCWHSPGSCYRLVDEIDPSDAPFVFRYLERGEEWPAWVAKRCSGMLHYSEQQSWTGIDPLGRVIRTEGGFLFADDVQFLDCRRKPRFETIAPPDWAKVW